MPSDRCTNANGETSTPSDSRSPANRASIPARSRNTKTMPASAGTTERTSLGPTAWGGLGRDSWVCAEELVETPAASRQRRMRPAVPLDINRLRQSSRRQPPGQMETIARVRRLVSRAPVRNARTVRFRHGAVNQTRRAATPMSGTHWGSVLVLRRPVVADGTVACAPPLRHCEARSPPSPARHHREPA